MDGELRRRRRFLSLPIEIIQDILIRLPVHEIYPLKDEYSLDGFFWKLKIEYDFVKVYLYVEPLDGTLNYGFNHDVYLTHETFREARITNYEKILGLVA